MIEKALSPIAILRLSWWMSSMVFIIMMVEQATSQSRVRSNTLLKRYCNSYNAINGEFYLSNLNTTFSSLRRQLSNPQVYYAFAQALDNDEYVYSFTMCREYLSTSQCLACFDSAVNETKVCGIADGGNIIYDDCSVRYENYAHIFDDAEGILGTDATLCGNGSASQPMITSNQMVQELLSDIQVATPRTSNFYVASTRQVSTGSVAVYAVAQCVKNTTQAICQKCLNSACNHLHACLPYTEGRAIDFLCFMKFSVVPFFLNNQTTNIIPFLSEGSSTKSCMISGVSSGVGLFLLILGLWLWYRRRKKSKSIGEDEYGLQGAKSYNYQDLRLATHNFGDEYRLGKGGFGEVFKAIIDDKNVVAVKRLYIGNGKAKLEYENEVSLLSNVQHRNIVQQLGWCSEGPELLLVLEYMRQGSLDKFLWGAKRGTLNWEKRFDIIFGVARGLSHLHKESHVKIIHRDIKSNNILLDDDLQPKIADFGLARFQPDDQTHVSTKLAAGTLGYMAPEYVTNGLLSEKVDTYSFGIVALEIVSGRKCTDENFGGPDTDHLLEHAWQLYEKGTHIELIDEALGNEEYHEANMMKTIEIALMCTQSPASLRPTMSEVILMLSSGKSLGSGQLIKPNFIASHRVIHIGANRLQNKQKS